MATIYLYCIVLLYYVRVFECIHMYYVRQIAKSNELGKISDYETLQQYQNREYLASSHWHSAITFFPKN